MARLARLFIPGCPQHVMQRGHNRMAVFHDDTDRQAYLAALIEALPARGVALHAWVLMGNHVHLLLSAARAEDTSAVLQSVGRRYTQWFNHRHGRSGTLWEGRYRSTVVTDDAYLMACYRYIDLNPVRAGLVARPEDWPWSSYGHHAGLRTDTFLQDHLLYWQLGNTPFERQARYRELCEQGLPSSMIDRISANTLSGWALGETSAGPLAKGMPSRRAGARPRGRPRREENEAVAQETGSMHQDKAFRIKDLAN